MEVSEESIRERIQYLMGIYKFNFYKDSKETWIERRVDYHKLIFNTNLSFIDIVIKVREKYNYSHWLTTTEQRTEREYTTGSREHREAFKFLRG